MRTRIVQRCKALVRAARASEFAVGVLFLLALSAVVPPRLSRASDSSRERSLADLLRYMRTQVQVYQSQHGGRSPGIVDGPKALPDASTFVAQMTGYTDGSGNVVPAGSTGCAFGPYLLEVPANPFTFQNGVLLVSGPTLPAPDNSQPYGWMYCPSTRHLVANVEGAGPDGMAYVNY